MNSEVSALSTNLSGLRMMPYRLQRSNQLTAWVKLSLRLGRYHFFRSQRAGGNRGDQVKISDEKRGKKIIVKEGGIKICSCFAFLQN